MYFFVLEEQYSYLLFWRDSGGPEKDLFDVSSPDKDLMQANLLIRTNSVGWTGLAVLLVLDEW